MDYVGTHLESAMALYRQREGWLYKDRVDMQSMIDMEYRLRVHIHVLSKCISEDDPEPGEAPDTFLYLATRFSSKNTEEVKKAAVQACEWLLEDSPMAHGARDALLLFPSPDVYSQMQKTYSEVESLRPVIIYILSQHGARLPKSLTHQADIQKKDPYLQAQTLYYASNNLNSDLNMFKENYESLITQHERSDVEHTVLLASLWGGLIRGDKDARIALSRAIEHEADDIARLDFLRYAALTGDANYYPLLCQVTEHAPEIGYHFLALHGKTNSVETILEGLIHPRTAEYAEEAWWWVSGQILPKKPRLSVVGEEEEEGAAEQAEEVGYVPDAQIAEQWWYKQSSEPDTRWLQGQPFSLDNLKKLMIQYTGSISNDLFDLFSLASQTPVQLGNQTWHDARLRKINRLECSASPQLNEINKEVRSA